MRKLYTVSKHSIIALNLFKREPKVFKSKLLLLFFSIFSLGTSYAQCPATTFTVSGGGSLCSGGTGVTISLSGSESGGITYFLVNSSSVDVASLPGTGAILNFNNITAGDTYTI